MTRITTQTTAMRDMAEGDEADRHLDTRFDLSTMQGVFDHVVTALLHQGGKSFLSHVLDDRETMTGDGLWSAYRSPKRRSPIGFLIDDSSYRDDLELLHLYSRDEAGGHPIQDALDHGISRDRGTIDLIWTLQKVHDRPRGRLARDADWRPAWKRTMRNVAELGGLDASVLDMPWRHETTPAACA